MIFSRAGFGALKFAYLVLIAGLGVGAFLVVGSYLYWQSEKKDAQQSQRSLQELSGRVVTAKRDREDLRGSEDTYKMLAARGIFLAEQRFDLIEALASLKKRHQLIALSYEVAPQRPLRLSPGSPYTGVNLAASRINLKFRALHDGDLVAFLDEFPRLQRGFFPIDRCAIKPGAAVLPAVTAASIAPEADDDTETPNLRPATATLTRPADVVIPPAPLEAECSLEWITLQTKGGAVPAPSASALSPNARPL